MAAGDGSSAGVCALPEAHTVSHLFRWAAVPLLLLVIFTIIPHCCTSGWLPVLGALREFVRRLKTKECDVYLDGRQYICYCCVFLIPLRHRWRILFCTLRTRQLVGTVLLYGLYTTARRYSNILLYTGYNLSVN